LVRFRSAFIAAVLVLMRRLIGYRSSLNGTVGFLPFL